MKAIGSLFDQIARYDHVCAAAWRATQGKRGCQEVASFFEPNQPNQAARSPERTGHQSPGCSAAKPWEGTSNRTKPCKGGTIPCAPTHSLSLPYRAQCHWVEIPRPVLRLPSALMFRPHRTGILDTRPSATEQHPGGWLTFLSCVHPAGHPPAECCWTFCGILARCGSTP